MDVAGIISQFRFLGGGLTTNQITDTNALLAINMSYRSNVNKIRQEVGENFFYDEWYIDSLEDTTTYALQKRNDDDGVDGMVEVSGVSIKYSDDGDYVKARPDSIGNKEKDLNRYSDNQSETDPFFILGSKSFSIYPKTEDVVTSGVYFYGISDPANLLIAGDEDSIKIPLEHQDTIALGALYYYYMSEKQIGTSIYYNDKTEALTNWNLAQDVMIKELGSRFSTTFESELADTSNLT